VQFDSTRGLKSCGIAKMYDYKDVFSEFFEFYGKFNFNKVISTHEGVTKDIHSYKGKYPKFLLKGIFIAGPINQGKNCGILDLFLKEYFISFCNKASKFLVKNAKNL
jgi:hypothetical protein